MNNKLKQAARTALDRLAAEGKLRKVNGHYRPNYDLTGLDGGKFLFFQPEQLNETKCLMRWCVIFDQLRLMPIGCLRCWKIVAKLPDACVTEQAWKAMKAEGLPGKAGLDVRSFTSGKFALFIYCDSPQDALNKWWRSGPIFESLGITDQILKRGCTEMEMIFGPSNRWKSGPGQDKLEKYLGKMLKLPPPGVEYTPEHIKKTMQGWRNAPDKPEPRDRLKTVTYHKKEWNTWAENTI